MFPKLLIVFVLFSTLAIANATELYAQCEGPDQIDFCSIDSARLETLLSRFPCLANRQIRDFSCDLCSPLLSAIKCGRTEIVKMLLEHESQIDMDQEAGTTDPVWEAFTDRTAWIHGPGDIGDEWQIGDTIITLVLNWASKHPNLISYKTTLFSKHERAILGRKQFLLRVQEVLDSCLSDAELFTDSTLIRLLISSGGKMNTHSKNWISLAVEKCSPKLLRFWISNGASVNFQDRNGDTPLYKAAMELKELSSARDEWTTEDKDSIYSQNFKQNIERKLKESETEFQNLSQIVETLRHFGGKE